MARVKSVTPVGEAPVYDIEVPYTHNFVANGMVVHNCHRVRRTPSRVSASMYRPGCASVCRRRRIGRMARNSSFMPTSARSE
jgi:hypothetical protein